MGSQRMRTDLLLIDGHNLMYRALFAPGPKLVSPTGERTAGTYIFTRTLLKLLRDTKPEHVALALDGPRKKLKRREWHKPYKATRKSPGAKEVWAQIKRMVQIAEALGIRTVKAKKWEADDVIATLARVAPGEWSVVIATSDKDFHQLLNPGVLCYDPSSSKYTDHVDAAERWGVPTKHIVDMQMLMGDSTDNIPGVHGVGKLKALKLVLRYGTAEAAKAAAAEQTPALRRALERTDLALMRKLVTLNRELKLGVSAPDLAFGGPSMATAAPVFDELGFKRLGTKRYQRKPKREGLFNER